MQNLSKHTLSARWFGTTCTCIGSLLRIVMLSAYFKWQFLAWAKIEATILTIRYANPNNDLKHTTERKDWNAATMTNAAYRGAFGRKTAVSMTLASAVRMQRVDKWNYFLWHTPWWETVSDKRKIKRRNDGASLRSPVIKKQPGNRFFTKRNLSNRLFVCVTVFLQFFPYTDRGTESFT